MHLRVLCLDFFDLLRLAVVLHERHSLESHFALHDGLVLVVDLVESLRDALLDVWRRRVVDQPSLMFGLLLTLNAFQVFVTLHRVATNEQLDSHGLIVRVVKTDRLRLMVANLNLAKVKNFGLQYFRRGHVAFDGDLNVADHVGVNGDRR